MELPDEVTHQLAVALRALGRIAEWATEPNQFLAINQAEQQVHEIRKTFEQTIPKN